MSIKAPWGYENRFKLVTLRAMLEFSLLAWSQVMYSLADLQCVANPQLLDSLTGDQEALLDPIRKIEAACQHLEMKSSARHAARLLNGDLFAGRDGLSVLEKIGELRQHILEDMETKQFLYVEGSFSDYYNREELFGPEVADKFPSAAFDIREAGNCLALGRSTACVFHLMRVLEIGLTAVGKIFNVSLAHTNWEPAIKEIEAKIRGMRQDPNWKSVSDYKEQQEFYAQAISYLGVAKDAWRNYTAHVRGKFTEEEAALMVKNIKAFMQKISVRLSE